MNQVLDAHSCFQARMSRDARFDGKFFTAVLTTGIFCRPVCPARAAKEENVRYFDSAQTALEAGFKPCKRCLPEHAPEQMRSILAQRMSEAVLTTNDNIASVAQQFQLSERQFRRNFIDTFGIAPKQYRQHHHVLLARKLLANTSLTVSQVCFAAGYSSLRQFNDQIKATYHCSPSALRKQQLKTNSQVAATQGINIKLHYRPPFDWQAMLKFFQLRQLPQLEQVTDNSYQRHFIIDGIQGEFKVTQISEQPALNLFVCLSDYKVLNKVIAKVRRMFDLDADMSIIHQQLSQDELLAPLVEKHAGIRLPGCWDIFEFSIRAILGQQISVKAATTLAGRIIDRYGRTRDNNLSIEQAVESSTSKHFPTPEQLASADFEGLGLTQSRINTLKTWVEFYNQQPDIFTSYQKLEELEAKLTALKGIGPWTVNYIAMRGLSDPNAFPAADLGVIKALTVKETELEIKPKPKQILERAQAWQPWRAYATLYLWLSLAE